MRVRRVFAHDDGSLRAGWRIALFLAIAVATTVTFAFLVAGGARLAGSAPPPDGLVLALGLLAAHAVMLRWLDGRPWSYAGLGRAHGAPRRLAEGAMLGALAIAVPVGLLMWFGWLEPQEVAGEGLGWARFILGMTWLLAWAALAEELLLRGYVFAALRDALGPLAAIALTSVVFGLLHLGNPDPSARSVLIVMLAGVFLGAVVLGTGSLYAAWMAHLAWNWVLVVVLHSPVSGIDIAAPGYQVVDAGPDWATGGSWGPEGGAFAAAGMLAGTTYLLARLRREHRQRAEG